MLDILKDKNLKKLLIILVIYKIFVLSFGTMTYYMVPEEFSHKNTELANPLIIPWHQFDTRAYMNIAEKGYNYEYGVTTTNFGWYPLYPLMIRAFGTVGYDIAAYLIPQIFSFLGFIALYMLLKDYGSSLARKTAIYMLMFPAAYFFTALYTESIFLFFSCMAFYFARREKWMYAGIMGYFAVLTRFIGISLFLPLLYMYARERGFKLSKIDRKIIFIFLIPAAFLTFMLYHYITFDDPLLQFYTQSNFSRGFGMLHTAFTNTIAEIMTTKSVFVVFYNYLNIAMSAAFVLILALFWRKIPAEYVIYTAFSFFMIFSSGILASVMRFELLMFPIFMAIAVASGKSRKFNLAVSAIFVAFFAMQLLALANHVNGEIDFVNYYRSLLP